MPCPATATPARPRTPPRCTDPFHRDASHARSHAPPRRHLEPPVRAADDRFAALPQARPEGRILLVTFIVVVVAGLAILGAITKFRKWGYLWREWFTTVDHKKLGIMYMILGTVMLLRGFSDAIMMRAQQAWAFGPHMGYLPPEHYDQI